MVKGKALTLLLGLGTVGTVGILDNLAGLQKYWPTIGCRNLEVVENLQYSANRMNFPAAEINDSKWNPFKYPNRAIESLGDKIDETLGTDYFVTSKNVEAVKDLTPAIDQLKLLHLQVNNGNDYLPAKVSENCKKLEDLNKQVKTLQSEFLSNKTSSSPKELEQRILNLQGEYKEMADNIDWRAVNDESSYYGYLLGALLLGYSVLGVFIDSYKTTRNTGRKIKKIAKNRKKNA